MRKSIVLILIKQVWQTAFKNKATIILMVTLGALFCYAAYTGYKTYVVQTQTALQYQKIVRANWLSKPDKNPHRMAHYGYVAFRPKSPLSFFDFGMESFTGNTIFLEAHKQNTVNFSEASFSTGILRFGEISIAVIIQLLIPILIFFIGFNSIATDRENGTLKIILSQGVSWLELLVGKTIGLVAVIAVLYLPIIIGSVAIWLVLNTNSIDLHTIAKITIISTSYLLYIAIYCAISVVVSAVGKTAKTALLSLIGIWLFFNIVMPKITQAVAANLYPAPSKIAFDSAIEKDLIKQGDSHNPDDAHYKKIKDSLLKVYKIDSVQQLPFNYSGFIMAEGEKISATIYNTHFEELMAIYQKQNAVSKYAAFLNPYLAIKHFSMGLAETDFSTYVNFQNQAESYRYQLAQKMNELQIQLISNKKQGKSDKPYVISKTHWHEMPDFIYQQQSFSSLLNNQLLTITALLFWLIVSTFMVIISSKNSNAL